MGRAAEGGFTLLFTTVSLAAIDSVAAVVVHEHPDASPSAFFARVIVCTLIGYSATRAPADAAVTAICVGAGALLSLALTDVAIFLARPPIAPGFAGVGAAVVRIAAPVVASAAGSILALALNRVGQRRRA